MPMEINPSIGIFDSGIGGLSVLRHIRSQLPNADVLYFADAGHAPYGAKPESEVVSRSVVIADFLLARGAMALVVACNTATAAAIAALRLRYPQVPLVGVEPGLKPAAAVTRNKTVGVLATEGTLASTKFLALRDQISKATGVRFLLQPCPGLATQVEKGELFSNATSILLQRFISPLMQDGADTLVLGCTHYPFVQPLIEELLVNQPANPVPIIDTGEAVARQLQRLLKLHELERGGGQDGRIEAFTTGSVTTLSTAFATLLKTCPMVSKVRSQSAS